jgi:hypothetical protein
MTLREGLVRGRSHIMFILGLVTAGTIIARVESAPAPTPPPPASAAQTEAATWAWAAASRSPSASDVALARQLAAGLGVRLDAAAPGAPAISPAAGLAALEGLAANRRGRATPVPPR